MAENVTIILPGIQGSSLEDLYPLDPSVTWSASEAAGSRIFGPSLRSLQLDSSGRHDAELEVVNRGRGLLPVVYAPLVTRLRDTSKLPVYVFAYDWRKSVAIAGEELVTFVDQVVERLAQHPDWTGKVSFVCHSMGGLVFRSFAAKYARPTCLDRVVFIAVPQRGSFDAVEGMVRGATALFGARKELRKLARTLPGVYELLPFGLPPDSFVDAAGNPVDVFAVANWQENVTSAVPDDSGFDVTQERLAAAFDTLRVLELPGDPGFPIPRHGALTIYGDVADSTLVRVSRKAGGDFDFSAMGSGDGTVPAVSALISGVQSVRLTMEHVSYFTETLARFQLHAFMPILDEVQSITDAFLKGRANLLPRNVEAATHLWTPP